MSWNCNQLMQSSCHLFWNYIYIMNYHDSLRFKNDLKWNQFMQISCHLFWNYIYISLSHGILDAKTILKMQPIHANFMSVVLGLYMYHGFLDTRIIWKCNQFMQISSHLFWKFKIQQLSALQPVHTIFMFFDVLWCLRHKFIKKRRDIFFTFLEIENSRNFDCIYARKMKAAKNPLVPCVFFRILYLNYKNQQNAKNEDIFQFHS